MLARPEWIVAPEVTPAAAPPHGLIVRMRSWRRRYAERRRLAVLDTRDLRDIGITRADVQHEVAKPFWRD